MSYLSFRVDKGRRENKLETNIKLLSIIVCLPGGGGGGVYIEVCRKEDVV